MSQLRLLKNLWDAIAMVAFYYDSWKAIKWDDIGTEEIEDMNRRLKNELRTTDKAIRQEFAPFEGLRDIHGGGHPCGRRSAAGVHAAATMDRCERGLRRQLQP